MLSIVSRGSRPKPRRNRRPQRRNSTANSNEELKLIWHQLQSAYFPEREDILDYAIVWSNRRHTRTLATCNVQSRRVRVAAAMKLPETQAYLPALVYHEMCHAILGVPERRGKRRVIHGREFKSLERRHPGIAQLNHWIARGGWYQAVKRHELQKRLAQGSR